MPEKITIPDLSKCFKLVYSQARWTKSRLKVKMDPVVGRIVSHTQGIVDMNNIAL
jgi:hypothetical protein